MLFRVGGAGKVAIDSANRGAIMSTAKGYRRFAAFAVILALSGCDIAVDGDGSTKINGSVHIPAGKAAEEARTVNGSIHVDDNAAVTSAATVNGRVRLGAHATATSMKTVNGAITLAEGARVPGSARSVNGELPLSNRAQISASLLTVNPQTTITS